MFVARPFLLSLNSGDNGADGEDTMLIKRCLLQQLRPGCWFKRRDKAGKLSKAVCRGAVLSKLDPELPEVASSYVIKSGFHMQALCIEAPAPSNAHSGCPNHLDACMSRCMNIQNLAIGQMRAHLKPIHALFWLSVLTVTLPGQM